MKRGAVLISVLTFTLTVTDPAIAEPSDAAGAYYRQDYALVQQLADGGNVEAMYLLGNMYSLGTGVQQGYREAVKWYRQAADLGYMAAQFSLALMYDNGVGVPQNYAEALKWFSRAANQGHRLAQESVGIMYAFGEGVAQDFIRAHMWFNLAAAAAEPGRREFAAKLRDDVAAKMTPAQIMAAQKLASEWKPQPER
jgi:TPR repeat protein